MIDGLIVVDKPAGWSSHQVVGRLRRILGTRKVGHAGTLDPMATGVLVVGVNRATRLLGHISLTTKSYTATIRLGQSSVTDDAEGETLELIGAGPIDPEILLEAMGRYVGTIVQVPSAVSAIKVNGQRAYARVRRGETVELAGREVTVTRYELLGSALAQVEGVEVLDLDVEVDCSSGTYIRALARDLGNDLGVGGHLTALRRTRVGGFSLGEPHLEPSDLAGDRPIEAGLVPLIGMAEVARRSFAVVDVDDEQARDIGFGRPLELTLPASPTALVHGSELLALYRPEGDRAVPVAVLA
ncbi:MAG: tRNA pseudouridine(55) synthase TruB [Propionicimonas sp.]